MCAFIAPLHDLQAYARENGTDSEEAAQSRPKVQPMALPRMAGPSAPSRDSPSHTLQESKVLGGKKPKKCTAQVFEMSDIEKHNRTRQEPYRGRQGLGGDHKAGLRGRPEGRA